MICGGGEPASRDPLTGSNPGDEVDGSIPMMQCDAGLTERLLADLPLAGLRSYLRSTVTTMSALIPQVLLIEGVEIDWVIHALRASGTWSSGASADPGNAASDRNAGLDGGDAATRVQVGGHQSSARIPCARPERTRIGIEVVGSRLELRVESETCMLSTIAGLGQVTLSFRLPESLATACPGRSLDDVVDHRLLRGRGFPVFGVIQHDAASTILFTVGELPVEIPDLCMDEGGGHDPS